MSNIPCTIPNTKAGRVFVPNQVWRLKPATQSLQPSQPHFGQSYILFFFFSCRDTLHHYMRPTAKSYSTSNTKPELPAGRLPSERYSKKKINRWVSSRCPEGPASCTFHQQSSLLLPHPFWVEHTDIT